MSDYTNTSFEKLSLTELRRLDKTRIFFCKRCIMWVIWLTDQTFDAYCSLNLTQKVVCVI